MDNTAPIINDWITRVIPLPQLGMFMTTCIWMLKHTDSRKLESSQACVLAQKCRFLLDALQSSANLQGLWIHYLLQKNHWIILVGSQWFIWEMIQKSWPWLTCTMDLIWKHFHKRNFLMPFQCIFSNLSSVPVRSYHSKNEKSQNKIIFLMLSIDP